MATLKSPVEDDYLTVDDVCDSMRNIARNIVMTAWSNTPKRVRMLLGLMFTSWLTITYLHPTVPKVPDIPKVYLDYGVVSPFNETKVALFIENRASPILAPLMLHFMSVVPPDWRFRFMGSEESVASINESMAIQHKVNIGKLDLTLIPDNMTTGSQEEISRFLTTLWLYEVVLQPAKHLLVFQTDSILCANSPQSLNSYLDYDWVGAPWSTDSRFGGNGGLSLRKVDSIIDVLRNQERPFFSEPEDVWLTDRLGARPDAKMANGTASLTFSGEMYTGEGVHVEGEHKNKKGKKKLKGQLEAKEGELIKEIDNWRDGFYEPMGYHTGGSGRDVHPQIWGTKEMRQHIYDYCPEVKMTLMMDAAEYVPGECNSVWKRGMEEVEEEEDDLSWIDRLVPF